MTEGAKVPITTGDQRSVKVNERCWFYFANWCPCGDRWPSRKGYALCPHTPTFPNREEQTQPQAPP